jgi:hypothetical protein
LFCEIEAGIVSSDFEKVKEAEVNMPGIDMAGYSSLF